MLRTRILTMTMNLALFGAAGILMQDALAAEAAALPASNPFAATSTLPYQAPPFDRIKDADYQPALEAGMREHIAEIAKISALADAPTFANTIEAMERSGQLLQRTAAVFFALTSADTNETLQKVEGEIAPKLAAHRDAIYLDDKLFQRVKKLYDARATLGLDAEQSELVQRYYRNFVRAGALLGEADKTKLRALNTEESTLTTEFGNKLLAAGTMSVISASAASGVFAIWSSSV